MPMPEIQAMHASHATFQAATQAPRLLQDELEEDDSLNEVMMAIDMRNRDTIGCCYYVAREEKLYMLSDVKFGGLDIIDTCK